MPIRIDDAICEDAAIALMLDDVDDWNEWYVNEFRHNASQYAGLKIVAFIHFPIPK